MSTSTVVVEHLVLFKAKDGIPISVLESAVDIIRALPTHISGIIQFHAGSTIGNLHHPTKWTHYICGRYVDKQALHAYDIHPKHLEVVKENAACMEEVLAVDWEATLDGEVVKADYGAGRAVVIKWKEGVAQEKIQELERSLANFPGIKRHTAGPNFSPERAKGFQWGFVAQFSTVEELKELQVSKKHEELLHSELVETFDIVDFSA
eukprot:c22818_g1_i1 orf=172-792(+)